MRLKRKYKIVLISLGSAMGITTIFTTVQSLQIDSKNSHKYNVQQTVNTFLDNNTADPKNSYPNTYDANLDRKPREPEPTPPKEVEEPLTILPDPPKIIDDKKEEPKPVDPPKLEEDALPIPTPVPPVEDTKPVEPDVPIQKTPIEVKPEPDKEPYERVQRRERKEINQGGIKFTADIAYLNPPKTERYDRDRGIANRIAYQNEFQEVEGIYNALTEANIKISVERSQKGAKDADWLFQNSNTSFHEVLHDEKLDIEAQIDFFKRNGDGAIESLGNLYARYFRLLEKPEKLKEYLDETGLKNFDKWWNMTKIFKYRPPLANQDVEVPLGKLLLLMHIDQSKINKVSDRVKKYLEEGYVISESGQVWVNENGEWESYVYSPPVNNVQLRIQYDNKNRRVLWNNETWPGRNSDDIRLGNYNGWTKTWANQEFEQNGYADLIAGFHGITINRFTNNKPEEGKLKEAIVVEIDVEQPKAYQNAKALIERLQKNNVKITGYRIKSIGRVGANQDMDKIFAALPNKLPMLELFFASKNTTALKYIKGKEIDELAMYTDQKLNALANDWAFNPWALNKVAWVNMDDYNISWGALNSQERIYSRISFDNLAFDEEDVIVNGKYDLTIINDGLRMAYWARNNERIFQGGWGGGNKPDSQRDGNSWPLGLDFSNAPSIKTLAGMVFEDVLGNNSTVRKLRRIKLFNDSDIWSVSAFEMNNAQFSKILITGEPGDPSKIFFSNGKETKKIMMRALEPGKGEKLNAEGAGNLRTLLNNSDGTFNSNTEIIVQAGEQALLDSLKSAGFNARYEVEDDKYIIL